MDIDKGARNFLLSLAPLDLHKKLINCYQIYNNAQSKRNKPIIQTDFDIIRKNHKFLWDDEPQTWEQNLAKKYYDKLFKEYCICDLILYKKGKIAMRWQTEQELISGKGQFICGYKECSNKDSLKTWEVNFAYLESGEQKNALVKLRLCSECSVKLNYKHQHDRAKKCKKRTHSNKHLTEKKCKKVKLEPESDTIVDKEYKSDTTEEESNKESDIWKGANKAVEEKSRDEDFEEFLEHLLL